MTKLNKVRMAGKSDFGEGSMATYILNDDAMEYEMAGGSVRFTMKDNSSELVFTAAERMAWLKAIEEAVKQKEQPPEARDRNVSDLVGKAVQFNYSGGAWKAIPTKEFKTVAWGKGLEAEVAGKLVENGLQPRPRWFGTEPMKVGDVTKLSSKSLDLVFDGVNEGNVEMTLKGMESVHGHPGAVFGVSGSFTMAESVNAESQKTIGEATIDNGRI